jgi:membrane protein required for colicin V production
MEGFTLVDGGVAVVILISAILAYSRGLVREVLSIAGWVVAAVVAFIFAPKAEPLIVEIPVVSDLLGGSCSISMISAFFGVFAITLIVVAIFTPLFAGAVKNSALGGIDQGLGFLFGAARGILLVIVAFIAYDMVVPADQGYALVEDSKSRTIFAGSQTQLEESVDQEGAQQWLIGKYADLTGNCEN